MVRCFVAIYPIEDRIIKKIKIIQEEINRFIIGKAVEEKNIHITLSFLGELSENEIMKVKENLRIVARKIKTVEIIIDGVKLIPSEYRIYVIALDVCGLEEMLKEVGKSVGGDIKPAHLTLFRVKKVLDRGKLTETCKNIVFNERMKIVDIKLMKSTLTRDGPIYEILESFPLLQ